MMCCFNMQHVETKQTKQKKAHLAVQMQMMTDN